MKVAASLAIALVLGSCSLGGGTSQSFPLAANAAYGPGTPILDGFVVADGTALVGMPIPTASGGWTAVMMLLGSASPAAVYDRYRTQASKNGMGLSPPSATACQRIRSTLKCEGSGGTPALTVSLTVRRESSTRGVPQPLILQVTPGQAAPEPRAWPTPTRSLALPGHGRPAARGALVKSPVPGSYGEYVAFRVEPGSEPLTPPMVDVRSVGGVGWLSMLRVTGNGEQVIDSYERQFAARGVGEAFPAQRPPLLKRAAFSLRTISRPGIAGGNGVRLTLVTPTVGDQFLLIEYDLRT
jgi:hypothetical protein